MSRFSPLVCALVIVACGEVGPVHETPIRTPPVARPNVVVVVLDTARADYFSSYGFDQPTTPVFDRLAAEGVRFERAFATDFWTLPSHASIFTGLYPSEAGATSETARLPPEPATLAERLKTVGYRTVGASCNSWISRERGFARGFDLFEETWRERERTVPEPLAVERAVQWIDESAEQEAPLFLFLNLNTAHLPYDPPPARASEFVRVRWPGGPLARVSKIAGPWAHLTGRLQLDERDYQMMRDLYATEIHLADELLGRIIAALERAGTLDETLVVVTSDHGENLGDHGRIGHTLSMYDTTLRVPLLLRWPAAVPSGHVEDDLASLVDLAPTILHLAAAAGPDEGEEVARRSLVGGQRSARSFVVAENDRPIHGVELLRRQFPDFDADSIDHPLRALRTDRYKLIWSPGAALELYDLEQDPDESEDLSNLRPELRDELYGRLRAWTRATRAADRGEAFRSQDPEALEWLRALGYID